MPASSAVPAMHPANTSPDSHNAAPCAVSNSANELFGQEVCHRSPLTEAGWDAAIVRARTAKQKHEARWHAEGCFAAKGDADRAQSLLDRLIAGRKAAA